VLLTLMGISITTTSDIDIQIAKNEQQYVREFYVADSAWKEGIQWLDIQASAPALINRNLFVIDPDASSALNVRNFGGETATAYQARGYTDDFEITPNGVLNTGSNQTNYWYSIAYVDQDVSMVGTQALSFGKGFRSYNFRVTGVSQGVNQANQTSVTVTVSKVYQVGE